nr:DNA polymerase Y family protein [Actinoplanes sp. N902-109]
MGGVRTLVVWCPDWPVVAAEIVEGVPAAEPVVVLRANRVVACSEAARAEGVRQGLRRREAQSRCPQLIVVEHDAGRDARAFEPVVAAVEEVAAGVEVVRPGVCAVAARGPSRYFGGEEPAAERIVEQIAQACGVESQVGVAEGVFAAGLAARAGQLVGAGLTREFLAGVPVDALERPGLADLLKRLGVRTLGDFAALPREDVLTRFGFDGALAHRLAAGADHRQLAVRKPPPDLEVTETYDEPLDRVDVAAFAGRALAERLHERLAAYGLACTRLGIEAVTADGQELQRIWRHDGLLTAAAIAERVRWQLDGWLTGARRNRIAGPTAGLVRLRLIPDGVIVHLGLQPGLWGDAGAERERAHRAFSRVQGLLGPESVVTAVAGGGRSADDQVRFVPWGDEREPARPAAAVAEPMAVVAVAATAHKPVNPMRETANPVREAANPVREPANLVREAANPVREAANSVREPANPVREAVNPVREAANSVREPANPVGEAARPVGRAGNAAAEGGVAGGGGEGGAAERGDAGKGDGAAGGSGRSGSGSVARGSGRSGSRGESRAEKLPPWPGRVPGPAPALVLRQPEGVVVLDAGGQPVGVSARLEVSGRPAVLLWDVPLEIVGWAGPWPVDERWWAPEEARRRARFQVAVADGRAFLVSLAGGHWTVEAIYD